MSATVRHTDPYPWPYAGMPAPSRLALVVAGSDPHWIARCPAPAALDVATRIASLAGPLRMAGATVVHVAHDRPARAPEVGAPAVAADSLREADDLVISAAGIDGFFGSPLDRRLRARACDHLLVCGFGLEAPVHSTLRSANDQGYECLLLTDACAPLDPLATGAALSMVTMSGGIFGALGTSSELLAAVSATVAHAATRPTASSVPTTPRGPTTPRCPTTPR
ncbi:MAG: cysteine hydrolase family protein [Acidimicrobiales bacterium]